MIIPDAMAAIMGEQYARSFFIPVNEKKSIIGALTMFILTNFIVLLLLGIFYDFTVSTNFLIASIVAIIATISELLSYRGSDNLSVPLISGMYLFALIAVPEIMTLQNILIGTLAAGFVALLSVKIKFLDYSGAMLAFLMGSIMFGFGGWMYTFPILSFSDFAIPTFAFPPPNSAFPFSHFRIPISHLNPI